MERRRTRTPFILSAKRRGAVADIVLGNLHSYTTDAGTRVSIPSTINAYDVLDLPRKPLTADAVKDAFRTKICTSDRQHRAMVALSYDIIIRIMSNLAIGAYSKCDDDGAVEVLRKDHFYMVLVGDCNGLRAMVQCGGLIPRCGPSLLTDTDETGYTLLYVAARSGHYDIVAYILSCLKSGEHLGTSFTPEGSALHAAAFYGHVPLVGLLLEHGAFVGQKNMFDLLPEDLAKTEEIRNMMSTFKNSVLQNLWTELQAERLGDSFRSIRATKLRRNGVIAKEITRVRPKQVSITAWQDIMHKWTPAWHGTRLDYVRSILKYGLLPAGSNLPDGVQIWPHEGHVSIGELYNDRRDWAEAVFVSPKLLYAAHVAYAERVMSNGERWCVVLRVRVRPGMFTSYNNAMRTYEPTDDEPYYAEYRAFEEAADDGQNNILRIEDRRDVAVQSVLFIKLKFLENYTEYGVKNYKDLVDALN